MSRLVREGELRARALLETPVDSVDDAGSLVRVWRPVASVWAKIAPRRGAEVFVAGKLFASRVTKEFTPMVSVRPID